VKALIIDLDDTAVDTSAVRSYRDRRDWKGCVQNLHRTIIFPDMKDTLARLRSEGIVIGFVTTSVSFYAERVLSGHGLAYDRLIAWHDCRPHKPDPAPIEMCLSRLGCAAGDAIGVGDSAIDAEAYRRANVLSVGAGWSQALVRGAGWDIIADAPSELWSQFR
jgi:phosphoglycolate phosphatase-like HAD superfamily hydrolase